MQERRGAGKEGCKKGKERCRKGGTQVYLVQPVVQSLVQASAGADLRCVNYCPQAG